MILNKIEMINFRQFYGKQEIAFAKGNQNITIVLGENGTGKTGLFRALIFSLFGELHITQDNQNDLLHIVNFKALEENQGAPTEAKVIIYFEDGGKKYQLSRSVIANKSGKDIKEKVTDTELYVTDSGGNFSPQPVTEEYEINSIIRKLVDEDTKDFFFFDGEKIDTLAKTDASVKKEVKNGIVKLLKIDEIEEAINILSDLARNEKSRITKASKNIDLENKEKESSEIENRINDLNEQVNVRKNEVPLIKKRIKEIESELNQSQKINELYENRNNIKENMKTQEQLVLSRKDRIKDTLLKHGTDILLFDTYHEVSNYLQQVSTEKNDFVSLTALKKSLEDKKCVVCGNDLEKHENHHLQVEMLLDNYKSNDLTPLITMIQGTINDNLLVQDEQVGEIHTALSNFKDSKQKLHREQMNLEKLNEEIKRETKSERDLFDLQNELTNLVAEEESISQMIINNEKEIIELKKNKEKVEKEFKELLSQNESLKIDQKVYEFITDLEAEFRNIFEEYSNEMRLRLSQETTNIFKNLIGSKDRDLINRININDKYEIEVIGWDDMNITADISQGQRQIVSLSFITALSTLATKSFENKNFPLFMDTPFGRISGENRDQLIKNIPNLTSQWILLLTDTELTSTEETQFKSTGKLGRSYRLNQIDKGVTEIEEYETDSYMTRRGGR